LHDGTDISFGHATEQPYPDLIRRLARQAEQDSRQSCSVNGGAMKFRSYCRNAPQLM
jgi:hypothetical protein